MTTDRHLERDLPAILGEISMGRYPDYIDDVLATTAQRRQRPVWTFPERWIPVELVTSRVPATRFPWRQIGVLAIIAVLLVAMLAVYVGSQQQRPLAPTFGVAANGLVAYADDGDIYAADPVTGLGKAIVTGPETDLYPVWSLDGGRFVFERKVEGGGAGWLYVANQDGRGLVKVTPEPLGDLAEYSFSPDGRSIVAFARSDRGMPIMVVASDGSGQPSFFHVPATAADGPAQYRPDGSEIMFIGRAPEGSFRNLYGLDPTTGKVRTIVAGSASADIHSAAWSPDGMHITYGAHDSTLNVFSALAHVVNADGTSDTIVDTHPDSIGSTEGTWSNDGTRLIITRVLGPDPEGLPRSVVVPIDRSSVGVELECPPGAPEANCTADWKWSPDDTVLLGTRVGPDGKPQHPLLADPQTGKIRAAPWTATGYPAWQRVAPAN